MFAALDESTGRRVALKRLSSSASAQMATLFEREFYVLSSLKHPRIIEVYDYALDDDGPYYTMGLLEGSDLRELSPMPANLACRYLRDVASSLALLHARRILHRDISPRNVRTLPDGSCKLLDFGALASFGTTEDIVGTAPAIPPEAVSGLPLDQRADLFSLGALGYYLLTGRHAYPARKVNELPAMWLERPLPPSAYAAEIPPELDELVLALLSVDALSRPASGAEVIDRLNVIAGFPTDADARVAQSYFVGAELVEREGELERVERRLARARRGRGDAVFIEGQAGVGKSRFLAEVSLKAQLGGTTVLRTDAAAHTGALSTVRALVQQLARTLPRVARKAIQPHAALFRAVWPDILEELDFTAEDAAPSTDSPSKSGAFAAMPSALVACLTEIAAKKPLLAAVDNVDRADAQSAALLMSLARSARTAHLVVATTSAAHHPAELTAALRGIRNAGTNLRLRELTEAGTVALVRAAFGDVPHVKRTATRLWSVSNGNPAHCMTLLGSWVARGLVHYTDGGWNLPIELPKDALQSVEHVVRDRLGNCSGSTRRVAVALAITAEPAPLELCVAAFTGMLPSLEVIAGLAELVEGDLVSQTPQGYTFPNEALRASVLENVESSVKSELHVRIAEAMLAGSSVTPQVQMAAGLHLIGGHDEARGAALIAEAARVICAEEREPGRLLAKNAPALVAALEVYRQAGRGNLSLLELLVPLCIASYEISYAFAMRYGEETVERIERALGLPSSLHEGHDFTMETLLPLLGAAPVLDAGEEKSERTPGVVQLVTWLIQTAMSLTASASAAINHEFQSRLVRALRPFIALGPNHPASAAHEYCQLILAMTEDGFSKAHAGWSSMLTRLDELQVPPAVKRRLRAAALYCLGVLECNRDDDAALARIDQVEAMNSPQAKVFANQLRFIYHGFRGDMESAQKYRDRVEAYAVQYGSAWQIEIWSSSTLSAVYGNSRDAANNKHIVEQLENIKKTAPSMEMHWERALGTQHALTGAHRKAVEVYERSLLTSPGHDVGWAATNGCLARAYNDLGEPETALRICQKTIAVCEVDRDYVGLMLTVFIERCRALAGLRDFAGAKHELKSLLDYHAKNKNPYTMGALNRAGAEIAKQEGDTRAFEAHLAAMESWFRPTNNPALIAQCDKLKNATSTAGGWKSVRSASGLFGITQMTLVQSVLANCEGGDARKQRALELVAEQAGTPDAWLFTRGPGERPALVGRLGLQDAPTGLYTLVSTLFEEDDSSDDDDDDDDDDDATAIVDNSSTTLQSPLSPMPPQDYRLLALIVNQGSAAHVLVGAIALPSRQLVGSVSPALLRDVATQLFQAGDVVTVRMVS